MARNRGVTRLHSRLMPLVGRKSPAPASLADWGRWRKPVSFQTCFALAPKPMIAMRCDALRYRYARVGGIVR